MPIPIPTPAPDWVEHLQTIKGIVQWGFGALCSAVVVLLGVIARLLWSGLTGIQKALGNLTTKVDEGFSKGDRRMNHHDVLLAELKATCDERHGRTPRRRWDDDPEVEEGTQ